MRSCEGYERCEQLARYMLEHNATVRTTAQRFGISKSTVHKDVSQTLEKVNPALWTAVKSVLEVNKKERHLRGGEATKQKYLFRSRNQERHCAKLNSSKISDV